MNKPAQRRWQVCPTNEPECRKSQEAYKNLIKELRVSDTKKDSTYMRMRIETFDKLLSIVGPSITKPFVSREPIGPGTKLLD